MINSWIRRFCIGLLSASALSLHAKMTPEQVASLPEPTSARVRFREDIQPIFEAACLKCHGRGKAKGGFSLETREAMLKGGDSGPAVVLGKSSESDLVEMVAGIDPSNIMPKKGTKLTRQQISLLRGWIDQGASWDPSISFAKQPSRNLTPHPVSLPELPGVQHPLDRLLSSYFTQHPLKNETVVDDRRFARRVYLDIQGVLPPPAELEAFVRESRKDKREALVTRLLADNQAYATHWFSFWNDLLRNDYRGTGYIDGGRKQISTWLYSALATNMPYNQFVARLIHPNSETEGFTKGIVWRGVVNASQTPPMQAAQNISQVFMGVNLKCASCHDSFINDWTLADAYGLASIYADDALELVECDKPTGKKATVRFLYPQLGTMASDQPKTNRTARLAELMTSPENGRLPRTIVNRLWARFFGRGLVEPVDDMEQAAWNPAVLDWLSEDLVAHRYDLKRTISLMLTSKAYQLPAVDLGERVGADFVFAGPAVRRMSAEQFRDALGSLTGVWHSSPATDVDLSAGLGEDELKRLTGPRRFKWLWDQPAAASKTAPGDLFLRKSFNLSKVPTRAMLVAMADDSYTLHLNGVQVLNEKDSKRAQFANPVAQLKVGENLIAIQANNAAPKPKDKEKEKEKDAPVEDPSSPAGVFVYLRMETGNSVTEIGTDKTWQCATNLPSDWKSPDFGVSRWHPAKEIAPWDGGPWKASAWITRALENAFEHDEIRASLVPADTLALALGRPNREQVMTVRGSSATTLQALELSNGETLFNLLKEGAGKRSQQKGITSSTLVREAFGKGLGRLPSAKESELALELLGKTPSAEQIADFYWAVAMLPEFQLIY